MNQINSEMDPLSNYEYAQYGAYNPPIPMNTPYNYEVKLESHPTVNQGYYNNLINNVQQETDKVLTNLNDSQNRITDSANVSNDKKDNPDQKNVLDSNSIKPLKKNVKKEKGKKSSYWSEKITDDSFKFYGCAVCDVSFPSLQDLDQHVTVHKDRVTSYGLKLKNMMKRQKLKKQNKNKTKDKSLKNKSTLEIEVPLLEIKPEDGYIGNEKASDFKDFLNQNNENQPSNNENLPSNNEDKKDLKLIDSKNICNDNGDNGSDEKSKYDLEKIYKCFACKKQFSLSYYLKLHVRSHTDEKPYSCSVCGQSFITASKLGRHNKRIHLAIRYQCRICYRFFSKFENLTNHFDKKHPDDKLEGEPYDYNAILPYLKELEEELREKAKVENSKKKEEDLFNVWGEPAQLALPAESKEEIEKSSRIEIPIEEVKVDPADIEIKVEPEEDNEGVDNNYPPLTEDLIEDSVEKEKEIEVLDEKMKYEDEQHIEDDDLNDSFSDDDYFPSNTWVTSPNMKSIPSPLPTETTQTLKCKVCGKTLSTISYLRIHMRIHTGEKPFKCYICNHGFITSSKMHRHVLTHRKSYKDDDSKESDVKADPDVNSEILDEKAFLKKVKSKFKKNKKHDKSKKRKPRPHCCEFCRKKFLHLETLEEHKRTHEGEQLVLKCNFCLEEMPDAEQLKEHESTHTGPKPYLCTICSKHYIKRETMMYHRKHHKCQKEFKCSMCEKSFNNHCKLQRHQLTHKVDKFVLRYECPVCAHMFHTKYHVQMHLATHQKEGLIYEENRNEILAMVLQNARKIPKHVEGTSLSDPVPSDERSRVCNICGEVFQHFFYLEEHLKSHGSRIAIEDLAKDEIKKHVCQICNKAFKLHYYLKLHSFTHTKEKPYICQECGKGFITKGKLKRHLETHTGLKRHQCHICYKFFTRTSYLRIHVRTIHGTQDYNFSLRKSLMKNLKVPEQNEH